MPLIKSREIKHNDTLGLLQEVARKSIAGELGNTNEERLANAQSILHLASDNLERNLYKFITHDERMLAMKNRVRLVYKRPEPVLITGPTGVGKEIIARAMTRPGQPFVAENCSGIPEALFESIFFGHVKGAFTGAHEDHTGLLEEAGDGVIFLDEIGDMPLAIQAKLLRAIQEDEIRKVGSIEKIDLSCRFVAATKYDLEERVDQRLFREDLFGRLMTYQVKITPLAERPGDVELITKSLLPNGKLEEIQWPFPEHIQKKINKFNVRAIEAALARWRAYGSYDE